MALLLLAQLAKLSLDSLLAFRHFVSLGSHAGWHCPLCLFCRNHEDSIPAQKAHHIASSAITSSR